MIDRKPNFMPRDRKRMNAFLGQMLDSYKEREITKEEAVGALSYVIAALETGNTAEAINWIENSRRRRA